MSGGGRAVKNSEEILIYIINRLKLCLKELNTKEADEFMYGEKTAYLECLEIIQLWEKAKLYGLDYDIEKSEPL